jgi:hypothetical protein
MQFAGQKIDSLSPNLTRDSKKLKGEYDLVLYNCTFIVIIEIKYKARIKDIDELLQKAPIFKQLYPEYAHYDLYLGLAALRINTDVENASKGKGIAVIKQMGENMVINDAHLKVF